MSASTSNLPQKMSRWRMRHKPTGKGLSPDEFVFETVPVPEVGEGQILTRTLYFSLDPYLSLHMRSWIGPGWDEGIITGRIISEVLVSKSPLAKPGDIILLAGHWSDYEVKDAEGLEPLDPKAAPLSTRLGVIGRSGLTAWVGLKLADLKPGQTVVVSAATGPVGSVAGQLAKFRGCRTIGIAGGADKCRHAVEQFGFERCLDYRDPAYEDKYAAAVPEGIDLLFENVGATSLDPALAHMKMGAQIIVCGLVQHYNDPGPVALRNFREILQRRLAIKAFATADYPQWFKEGTAELEALVASGKMKYAETLIDGLEKAPTSYIEMLGGGGIGKRVIRVA